MAAYLVLFWRYVNGWGWPKSTSVERRKSLRANSVSADVWIMSFAAGVLAVGVAVALQSAYGQLVAMPHDQPPDFSALNHGIAHTWYRLPFYMLISAIFIGSIFSHDNYSRGLRCSGVSADLADGKPDPRLAGRIIKNGPRAAASVGVDADFCG